MLNHVVRLAGGLSQRHPAMRGYGILYRQGEVNFCPGCGRSHWYIGRLMAECAYCGTALPLQDCDVQSASGGRMAAIRIRKRDLL